MIPYLCGGTFLAQVLRVTKRTTTPADHLDSKKESLPEHEVFRRLLSIYRLADVPKAAGDSLKTSTSKFKSCKDSLVALAGFMDSDSRRMFDDDVRSKHSKACSMMAKFVSECVSDKYEARQQLVRCILGMIKHDEEIQPDDEFCILLGGGSITKREMLGLDRFYIEPFLLGIWHFIIMNRAEKNEQGAETYRSWYPRRDDYRGDVGRDITMPFKVESAKINEPITSEAPNDTFTENEGARSIRRAQFIDDATIVNITGEKVVYAKNIGVLNL